MAAGDDDDGDNARPLMAARRLPAAVVLAMALTSLMRCVFDREGVGVSVCVWV